MSATDMFAQRGRSSIANGTDTIQLRRDGKPFEKAEFWMNFVADVPVMDEDGKVIEIIRVTVHGVPADNLEVEKITSSSDSFAIKKGLRNELVEQLRATMQGMSSGDEVPLNFTPILRRVNGENGAAKNAKALLKGFTLVTK